MGLNITATKSSYDFYMGYGGFFNLRKNIALALDKDFGENYAKLINCHTDEEYAENDRMSEWIINSKHLDENYKEVLDFLYMSDCEGQISHKTCKQILDLIKEIDFEDKIFRYGAYAGNDYEDFKEFLAECYSNRRKLRWS